LREDCEGRFEIAIGSGIHNDELQAQRVRRRLQVCDGGLGSRKRGSARTPNRAALGINSRSNWNCFGASSPCKLAMPVAFALGRLRLATRPNATGSLPMPKTIGMVVVADFASNAATVSMVTITATAADEIGCERRQAIVLICRQAVFNQNILALDIAGFLQALEKRDGDDLGVISGLGAEISDHRHCRLLCPGHERPRRRAAHPPAMNSRRRIP
jgi:hypothetical protein